MLSNPGESSGEARNSRTPPREKLQEHFLESCSTVLILALSSDILEALFWPVTLEYSPINQWARISCMMSGLNSAVLGVDLVHEFSIVKRVQPYLPVNQQESVHCKRSNDSIHIGYIPGAFNW